MVDTKRQHTEAKIQEAPIEDKKIRRRLLEAIDDSSGRVTSADLVVSSGLPPGDVERVLRDIVMTYECRIDVDDDGRMVYDFGKSPSLRDRERDAWHERFGSWAWKAFQAVFKVTIAVVLVGYVVFFVALLIAMMVASQSNNNNNNRMRIGGSRGGGGSFWFWFWIFGRDSRSRNRVSPSAHRFAGDRRGGEKDERPFYKKVYGFVFGPEHDELDILEDEQQILAWIRSEQGVIAPSELAARTGWTLEAAETESTRLLAAYDGSVEILPDGTTVYSFKDLMHSEDARRGKIAEPFWRQWEAKEPVTGNSAGANFGIAAMNLFVLVMAGFLATGVEGTQLATGFGVGAVVVPLIYSVIFFSVPALRAAFSVRPENDRRKDRNIRRAVMRHVFSYSEGNAQRIYMDEAVSLIAKKVANSAVVPKDVDGAVEVELRRMAAEYDAHADVDQDGRMFFRFDRIAAEKNAALAVRNGESSTGGQHWFDSEMAAFDEKLAAAGIETGDAVANMSAMPGEESIFAESVPSDEEWEARLKN